MILASVDGLFDSIALLPAVFVRGLWSGLGNFGTSSYVGVLGDLCLFIDGRSW